MPVLYPPCGLYDLETSLTSQAAAQTTKKFSSGRDISPKLMVSVARLMSVMELGCHLLPLNYHC